jgi:hypothetical protein
MIKKRRRGENCQKAAERGCKLSATCVFHLIRWLIASSGGYNLITMYVILFDSPFICLQNKT